MSINPIDPNGLVDTRRAASLLGLDHATLQNWRCRGEGPPFIRLGRAIRYRPDDLETWIESHRVAPGEAGNTALTPANTESTPRQTPRAACAGAPGKQSSIAGPVVRFGIFAGGAA